MRRIGYDGLNTEKPPRNCAIELMRILAMLSIVAHHFVVNSGVQELYTYAAPSSKMLFCQLFGMWGKTAINAFVLVSGYFMCTSALTARRFLKLLLEVMFYAVIVYVGLGVAGYESFSSKQLFHVLFGNLRYVNDGFTPSFLWFYLGIPFYNVLIRHLGRQDMMKLIGLLLAMFTGTATFFFNVSVFNYVFWYMTLYFIGAFIRLNSYEWMNSQKTCCTLLLFIVVCSCLSVVLVDVLCARHILDPVCMHLDYFFVSDSNKLLALAAGVALFLVFKNLNLKFLSVWGRIINSVAATTFGVLLIHAASDGMRKLLWRDVFDVCAFYRDTTLLHFIGMAVGACIFVFLFCSVADQLRIK